MKFAIVLLLVTFSFAQDAVVLQLKPEDAAMARSVHQQMLDAEKRWKDLQTEITNKYLIVDKTDPDASMEEWYPPESGLTSGITWGFDTLGTDECDPKYA